MISRNLIFHDITKAFDDNDLKLSENLKLKKNIVRNKKHTEYT